MGRLHTTALRAAALALIGGVVATGGSAGAAPPPPITATDEVVLQPTDWTHNVELPLFDSSLGILQSAELTFSATVQGSAAIENRSPSPAPISTELAAVVTLETGIPRLGPLTVRPSDSRFELLPGFDGTNDRAGPSGRTYPSLSRTLTQVETITDPTELRLLSGAGGGTVILQASAVAQSRASGSGNVSQDFDTNAGASVSVTYRYLIPGISIDKTPDNQVVNPGDDATFTITVTNTGDTPLENVLVSDDEAPACNSDIGSLAVGATVTYQCIMNGVTAAVTNIARVFGVAPDPVENPRPVSDEDDARVTVTSPAITLTKTANPSEVITGGTTTFTLVVTNTGDVDLTDVTVTDPNAPGCAKVIGNLAKGASETITCDVSGIETTLVNTATVTGKAGRAEVRASDDAEVKVLVGAVDIEKAVNGDDADTAPGVSVPAGDGVTFSFVVTNSGPTALTDLAVSDDKLGPITCPKTTLAVGEAMTCTPVTGTAVAGTVTNTATVTGRSGTAPVGDSDPANHTGLTGGIDIEKFVNGDDADTAPGVSVPTGTEVTFTFTVTNTGPTALTGVTVSDDKLGPITCPKTTLAPAEAMNCTPVSGRAVSGTVTNTATVTGRSGTQPVTDTDPANHTGTTPPPPPVSVPCPADNLLTGLRFEVNGGQQVAPSLSQLTIRAGDTVSMVWTGTRAGEENCDVSLALYKAHTPVFTPSDEQRLLASARCVPGTTGDCLQPNGERRLSLVVNPEPDCPFQLDAVTGVALPTVGPSGGYYSAILSGGTNRLISAIYVPVRP
jgi:uncharacterized repeat protein (TIGR01451 family)